MGTSQEQNIYKIKLNKHNYDRLYLYILRAMNMARDLSIINTTDPCLQLLQSELPEEIIENGKKILDDLVY